MKKKIVIGLVILAVITLVILWKKGKLGGFVKKGIMKHFDLTEFDTPAVSSELGNKDTYLKGSRAYVTDSAKRNMDSNFLAMIDSARVQVEKGWNKLHLSDRIIFKINSGYRSPTYNDTLKGSVPNSAHTYGKAVDLAWGGYTLAQKQEMLIELYNVGFRRFGIANTFLHVDSADTTSGHPTPAVWTYSGVGNAPVTNINDIIALTEV